jgi:hypothetical protein
MENAGPAIWIDEEEYDRDQIRTIAVRDGYDDSEMGRVHGMSDLWIVGPTALAFGLRRRGFSIREAERLVVLKIRYVRGEFSEMTEPQKRLRFAHWLVNHGWLSEDTDDERES